MGEIRFVGTGETRRYPYLLCKKYVSLLVRLVSLHLADFTCNSFFKV